MLLLPILPVIFYTLQQVLLQPANVIFVEAKKKKNQSFDLIPCNWTLLFVLRAEYASVLFSSSSYFPAE